MNPEALHPCPERCCITGVPHCGYQFLEHHDQLKGEEVVEEAENGRDGSANGNADEENGQKEVNTEVGDEEEKDGEEEEKEDPGEEENGDEDEEVEALGATDDEVDTKRQKTDSKKGKLN
ncbi:hypothetical protein GW7_01256 [Heterocephalus glaber]|uniref:Prothymosin alpha n=1 Tax=Heterocephalus glaber TaxID=10181 RepID=G5BIT0_HETGA|nr:hypothetical protein GW7_01256 [Heterocephalus glaber]